MYGLMLLGIALVYIALVGWLLYKVKVAKWRIAIVVAAILIPNADDWFYRYQLAQYCKNEAGYKVYEQASRKEGLVSEDFLGESLGARFAQNTPLAFIEGSTSKPNVKGESITTLWRAESRLNGTASPTFPIQSYSASYELALVDEDFGPYLLRRYAITHRQTGRLIAEVKGRVHYGGWFSPRLFSVRALIAGCGVAENDKHPKEIKVLTRHEWPYAKDKLEDYEKLINLTFTKD